MKTLTESPVLFVHYPTGAGGWFLASLLHYAADQSTPFYFDAHGSGHANQTIRLINNWYTDVVCSPIGMAIIHNNEHELYSKSDRINFLRNNVTSTDIANTQIPHIISLHCVDINLFLEAFPNSRCIQIIVEDHNILTCAVLFLIKKLSFERFSQFAQYFDIPESDYRILFEQLNKIQAPEDMQNFAWAIPYIKSLDKGVENNPEYDDRFLEIMFEDWMNADIDEVLGAFLNFAKIETTQSVYDSLVVYIRKYRSQQLSFVTKNTYE
jgi:hypothetical protein